MQSVYRYVLWYYGSMYEGGQGRREGGGWERDRDSLVSRME